jgi:hypothetical protein
MMSKISEAARALGKIGGSKKTERKKKSSALNGKKGGRPKGSKNGATPLVTNKAKKVKASSKSRSA